MRYRKHIKSFKPDVIIVSSLSILTFLTGILFKRWLKIPLVIEIRDIYPLTLTEIGNYSPSHPVIQFLQWIEKLGYKNADLLISTLPNAREHIGQVLKGPFQFLWLPMGIDVDYYDKPLIVGTQNVFEKKPGEFLIGYAGTMGKANALDVIFATAVELEKTLPQIRFVLVGDGPLKSMYQKKYEELRNVIFLPPLPKNALQPLLHKMDVLINTWLNRPIYNFGISPNKWIDYMLAAKPLLIAFNGYDEIVKEANCGIIVPAENKEALKEGIIKLFNMPKDELTELGENGKKYLLQRLNYQKLTQDLNEVLKLIVA